MRISFLGPFAELAGSELELALPGSISLRELIAELAVRFPGFARYAALDSDHGLSAHVCFLRQGRPLKLAERVQDQDQIQVLLPVTGG
ncbi:MAG: hypothetical protein C4525_10540 [Desulfarculus sp.]|jgi:molybdopterin converting factor small subunit|nr:MAG: hypothetical protein C4525_10540 [Desulfarculus sp.]